MDLQSKIDFVLIFVAVFILQVFKANVKNKKLILNNCVIFIYLFVYLPPPRDSFRDEAKSYSWI